MFFEVRVTENVDTANKNGQKLCQYASEKKKLLITDKIIITMKATNYFKVIIHIFQYYCF
jgi:hypothetical protein